MTEKEGVLQMQPSGRWAVCRPGRGPWRSRQANCSASKWTARRHCG